MARGPIQKIPDWNLTQYIAGHMVRCQGLNLPEKQTLYGPVYMMFDPA